jgi:hypothetical protein
MDDTKLERVWFELKNNVPVFNWRYDGMEDEKEQSDVDVYKNTDIKYNDGYVSIDHVLKIIEQYLGDKNNG